MQIGRQTALVTGGSRGIGKAIVEQLRNRGINVLTPSRQELDLLSNVAIDNYLMSLTKPIDILVNDAGINRLGGPEFSDSDLQDTLQINLIGPVRLTRGLVQGMIQRRFGRIVNISSIWSVVSKPGRITYSISKTGLNGFTRSLAVDVAPFNVLVNAVAPGYVNTELTRQNNTAQSIDAISKMIPLQRLAEPEEIAKLVAFLCSGDNTYLTGQCIVADGGYSCL